MIWRGRKTKKRKKRRKEDETGSGEKGLMKKTRVEKKTERGNSI